MPTEVAGADDDVTTGVRPRDSHRRTRCLGAALEELNHLCARDDFAEAFRELHLAVVAQARDVAVRRSVDDGTRDGWLGITKRNRAKCHRAIDILISVDVKDATADGA